MERYLPIVFVGLLLLWGICHFIAFLLRSNKRQEENNITPLPSRFKPGYANFYHDMPRPLHVPGPVTPVPPAPYPEVMPTSRTAQQDDDDGLDAESVLVVAEVLEALLPDGSPVDEEPRFEGNGGEFGGAGASGDWDNNTNDIDTSTDTPDLDTSSGSSND